MTIQEALKDLMDREDMENRVAEDMFTRARIYGDYSLDRQCVSARSINSTQWITRDVR